MKSFGKGWISDAGYSQLNSVLLKLLYQKKNNKPNSPLKLHNNIAWDLI